MKICLTDWHMNETERLRAERDALLVKVGLIAGQTALRCIEMAKWPQGLYDEQAYYGQMFAEFIEKEFHSEIDAALAAKERT